MATEKKKGAGKKAASKKANGAQDAGEKKGRRTAPAGMGHNLTAIRKQAKEVSAGYHELLNEKEKLNGEIMGQVKDLLESGANRLGCSRKVLRMVLHEERAEMKRQARIKELEASERDDMETLEDALGLYADTPLGQAAAKAEKANEPAFNEGP